MRSQKVKLLIPGHIPGSFCEFPFPRLTRRHSRWDGNECFSEIATHPSHNTRLNPVQFVRSNSAYLLYFPPDSVRSSFNSFAVNAGVNSARLRWVPVQEQPNLPALPICRAEVRRQKVKLLIPGHIPGSFCEFRIVCLILRTFANATSPRRLKRPAATAIVSDQGWRRPFFSRSAPPET